MKKFNFELQMATLIPEFVYQFLLNGAIDQDSITCLELEDLGDALKTVNDAELNEIKKFLSMENDTESGEEHECEEGCEHGHAHKDPLVPKSVEETMEEVDAELEEVDDEYYHRYTPAELRYIFDKVIDKIEKIYDYYLDYATVNLTLSVNFRMKDGLESNLVVEFLGHGMKVEDIEETFYVTVKNAMASDDIAVRVYFYYDTQKTAEYEKSFNDITDVMNVKHDGKYNKGLN